MCTILLWWNLYGSFSFFGVLWLAEWFGLVVGCFYFKLDGASIGVFKPVMKRPGANEVL